MAFVRIQALLYTFAVNYRSLRRATLSCQNYEGCLNIRGSVSKLQAKNDISRMYSKNFVSVESINISMCDWSFQIKLEKLQYITDTAHNIKYADKKELKCLTEKQQEIFCNNSGMT